MSITRSRAALCVVDPGTRPARYGRWSDGIFRKYSVRINSEQEAKHGKKKERAPSTPRERRILPRELRRPPASGSGYGAPTRPPRPLSGSSGIHVNYNFKPRQTPTPDPREHKRSRRQPGVRRSDTHFTPHTLIIKTYIVIANLLLFICVCRHEKDRKMNSLCQA